MCYIPSLLWWVTNCRGGAGLVFTEYEYLCSPRVCGRLYTVRQKLVESFLPICHSAFLQPLSSFPQPPILPLCLAHTGRDCTIPRRSVHYIKCVDRWCLAEPRVVSAGIGTSTVPPVLSTYACYTRRLRSLPVSVATLLRKDGFSNSSSSSSFTRRSEKSISLSRTLQAHGVSMSTLVVSPPQFAVG